ncbi:hypothetical protein [Salinimicrobium terrae]|uniref:hypothetical protein n=1 Tax=Salinimicrobium terrae TaxID=470866 RepID=UPI0003F7E33B|nr:hypothetical protein [Salinimicrobium terrae]
MKNFKISIAWLAMFALIFTSCSKEEEAGVVTDDPETVQLTFGALLNAFNDQNKQSEAECRDNAVPAYVMIGGSTNANDEVAEEHWFEVGLVNNNGSWETTYSEDLALPAGTYYLHHFIVYDAGGNVLWVAPREGSTFEPEVGDALPIEIELVAGTKPYIDVDVLCYYSREEAAYGYPFFDFDVIEVENSYCIFVNYCDDETGRDYPAYFNVDVFTDAAMTDEVNISNDTNSITMAGEWPSASVLCFALPDLGDDTYYARVTVMNHDYLDYTADASDYYDFEITQASIIALEAQEPGYHHIRFECGETTPPPVNFDCTEDFNDQTWSDIGNCNFYYVNGTDSFVEINAEKPLFLAELGSNNPVEDLTIMLNDSNDLVISTTDFGLDFASGFEVVVTDNETFCESFLLDYRSNTAEITASINDIMELSADNVSYPLWVKVRVLVCPPEA